MGLMSSLADTYARSAQNGIAGPLCPMALLAAHVERGMRATVCVDGGILVNSIHATAHIWQAWNTPECRIEFRKIEREKNVIHTRMMINHTRAD